MVTTLLWPADSPQQLYFGQADGKVRTIDLRAKRLQTLLPSTSSPVISLVYSPRGRSLLAGYLNGKIMLYSFDADSDPVCFYRILFVFIECHISSITFVSPSRFKLRSHSYAINALQPASASALRLL